MLLQGREALKHVAAAGVELEEEISNLIGQTL